MASTERQAGAQRPRRKAKETPSSEVFEVLSDVLLEQEDLTLTPERSEALAHRLGQALDQARLLRPAR